MFFLTNMYERRLNNNMRRHPMDYKIAPSKPQPRMHAPHRHPSPIREKTGDQPLLNRFLETRQSKSSITDTITPSIPPPTYQDVVKPEPKIELIAAFKPVAKSSYEMKKPIDHASLKPRNRTGSFESAVYTDSDAASNASFAV